MDERMYVMHGCIRYKCLARSQFSFLLPADKETWTWHAVSLIISWTLFSQSYFFFFSFIYVLLKCVCMDDTLGRAHGK